MNIPNLKVLIPTILVFTIVPAASLGISNFGGDFRYLLFLMVLIVMITVMVMEKKQALRIGFILWILMFIIGYRTIQLTANFSLHPLIVFLVLLYIISLFILKAESNTHQNLPGLLWVFSIFWFWGFIPGALSGLQWSEMMSEALNFFLIFPLFTIILYLSKEPGFWKAATLAFLGSGVLICLLGTIEFYIPQFRVFLPGLIQAKLEGLVSQSGFTRASFAFFGATPAVIISALALPMVGLVPRYYKSKFAIPLSFILLIILGIGIYISGTRVAWLMVFCASIIMAYFGKGLIGIGLSAISWSVVSIVMSTEARNLLFTLYTPFVSGLISDTSLQKRVLRQEDALELAFRNPFGVGWAGSGWVHGDFTQVAANLGVVAGIIFLAWYFHTLFRGWKTYRKNPTDWLFHAILTSFILCGVVLFTEGAQVLVQFIMPVWFVWGLMEAYLQQNNKEDY